MFSMTCYDLHTHSSTSDGSLAPEVLVQRAIEQQVDVLALTDHDGVEGIDTALQTAAETELTLIPGVEISVSWGKQTVHIVGLNIDHHHYTLREGLYQLRQYRLQRAKEIAHRLAKAGIDGAFEGASQYASPVMLGRVHFAKFLVEQNHAKDIHDVFKRFLVRNKPGYVPGEWTDLEQALQWINGAGGHAVVAHPARYRMTATKRKRLLAEFSELGGVGIEVVSGRQHPEEVKVMAKLANDYNLLASCGSDFHSPEAWNELGKMSKLPSNVEPIWTRWAQ